MAIVKEWHQRRGQSGPATPRADPGSLTGLGLALREHLHKGPAHRLPRLLVSDETVVNVDRWYMGGNRCLASRAIASPHARSGRHFARRITVHPCATNTAVSS